MQYAGILLQARTVDTRVIVGRWTPSVYSGIRLKSCSAEADSLTHSNELPKPVTTRYTWNAPTLPFGDIEFVATLAVDYETFWTVVTSEVVRLDETVITQCKLSKLETSITILYFRNKKKQTKI
ncbi:putative defense protein 3 [Anneissia japonica]|uniref:putative defense protein 3 n=1 Tax=Anneissia japonica TaxID=1529436 RepID=UPI0014255600|nr:putative defense protein 3 [Anneissia japonica]